MAKIVIMPRQGITVESCIITKWNKATGDTVEPGDVLFSYETDKAAFEEKAQDGGVMLKQLYDEGDDVPCLEAVCIIGEAGEDISDLVAQSAPADEAAQPEAAAAAAQEPAQTAAAAAPVQATVNPDGALKISPRARMSAQRLGIDAQLATPTGPDGRIIERDILAVQAQGVLQARMPKAEAAVQTEVPAAPAPVAAAYHDEPLPNIRKVIARSMHASLSEMAQLTHHASFDATNILALRAQMKAKGEALGLPNITIGDMVLYAVTRILPQYPDLNAHFLGDRMRYFNDVNLGLAVDTDRGLMVPTIMAADKLSLAELAQATKKAAAECRSGSISPDALTGASFTVSNLGSYGVEMFTPVINPPQTGILGVCASVYRPRPDAQGNMQFYPAMGLSLTYDHRALDGAPATRFLKQLCDALENFNLLLAR